MVRYDAAIIGAGGDGLAAAIVLARAGLKTVVLDRASRPGGRLCTREFHPGFRASPFLDDLAPIPSALFWSLGLARAGARLAPVPASLALGPSGRSLIGRGRGGAALDLLTGADARIAAALARAAGEAGPPPRRFEFFHRPAYRPWPGEDWLLPSLGDLLAGHIADPALRAHLMARVLAGRACDPFLAGSAVQLLAPASGGLTVRGGAGALAEVLARLAREAGAEIRCDAEAGEIRRDRNGVSTVVLAGGEEVIARALVSTLDLKQTFLSLFVWDALPPELLRRVGRFRMAGGTARVLFALDAPPELARGIRRADLHVAPSPEAFAEAHAAWRAGMIPEGPPVLLRLVSARDPGLAPMGKAVLTATLSAIPFRLFDGAWTHEKRALLRERALAAAERALPGVSARVLAAEVIVPPDIEAALGATEGDLMGGELAPDQMLGARPWLGFSAPRTPVRGLYLAGPSTPAGASSSLASGACAAGAVLADLNEGHLK
ncbi:MAG: NAD(P)/FAD-dependent oxidoreductase [Pseudomonadota bacterium]|nr:NAD(P)/FAD-dependent oxidoreductase [Pseudomonadota bacterium]